MRIVNDIIGNSIISRYGEKANELGVSKLMIIGRTGENGISILDMVKKSNSRKEFSLAVKMELQLYRNTDFYHYSLLMGQFFGVYNIYNYMFIAPNVRNELIISQPNVNKTVEFFNMNNVEIFSYINKKYGLGQSEYVDLVNNMFSLNNDYSVYNNAIINDIGMILMGNQLFRADTNSRTFLGCRGCINYFNRKNEEKKNIVRK